ncbi:MAG: hypothetical protein P4L84_05130 [Isosphaeraceae bacterium]|nr:hypothetical protein [Isosphaeraceae bacterium]
MNEESGTRADGEARRTADYSTQYLEDLVTEFNAQKLEVDLDDPRVKRATDLIEETLKKKRLCWADVFIIERAILRLQSPDRLRRRVWSLRDKFRVVIGEQAYAVYERSGPPDPSDLKTTADELRSDIDQLLSEFHWLYLTTPVRERVRNHLSKRIAIGMMVACSTTRGTARKTGIRTGSRTSRTSIASEQ